MIDLADLDRKASMQWGWRECIEEPHKEVWWTPPGKSCDEVIHNCRDYPPRPSRRADDCWEFERWALAHGAITIGTIVESNVATASIHVLTSGRWRSAHTNPAEHGPSYDLVARVLALLDALETEK